MTEELKASENKRKKMPPLIWIFIISVSKIHNGFSSPTSLHNFHSQSTIFINVLSVGLNPKQNLSSILDRQIGTFAKIWNLQHCKSTFENLTSNI